MKFLKSTLIGLLGLALSPLTSFAQLNEYLGNVLIGQTVTLQRGADFTGETVNIAVMNVGAAGFRLTINHLNSSGQAVTTSNVPVFCTDLNDSIGGSLYNYNVIRGDAHLFPLNDNGNPAVSVDQMMALGYLYKKAFGTAQNYLSLIPVWDPYKIAGFQTAIWEVTHDHWKDTNNNYGFSLTNGNIFNNSGSSAMTFAEGLLTQTRQAIANNEGNPMSVVVFTNGTVQDLVMPYSPVPEPSTYALMGAGSLLGLAALRRRKRAAKQAA